jgi:peptide deformylase
MIRQVVKVGDDNDFVLRQQCQRAEYPFPHEQIVADLFDTLDEHEIGIGLSAPQIGLPYRIFVIDYNGVREAFINPVIRRVSHNRTSAPEGCLSLPVGFSVPVVRPKQIWLDFTDESGILHTNQKFRKTEARIILHECDHLDGVLITDRHISQQREQNK